MVTHLLDEIRELGYTGSANLPVRCLNQGRAGSDRPVTTPRRLARLMLTHPEHLRTKDTALPHHNGRTEGVNTRTKGIMRQMHGGAGFDLLRHRISLR